MELEDIIDSQNELLEQSRAYFEDWYAREEELRREFTEGEDE